MIGLNKIDAELISMYNSELSRSLMNMWGEEQNEEQGASLLS